MTDSNLVQPESINIYNNNIYNIYNTDIILDNKEQLNHCSDQQQRFFECLECGTHYFMNVGCDKRTCSFCMNKRKNRLYAKYEPLIKTWDNGVGGNYIQFLTLTFKNVFDLEVYTKRDGVKKKSDYFQDYTILRSKYIERCNRYLSAFIRRLKRLNYVFDYGFINKEMTYSQDNGYHYHFHILFYGKPIDLKKMNISRIWKDVTKDSYIVKLLPISAFNDKSHALRYLMKYVSKVENDSKEVQQYYDLTKGNRYFNTFGKKYGKIDIKKNPLVCVCGGKLRMIFALTPKNPKEYDFEEVYNKSKSEHLLDKISKFLFIDSNISFIENILSDDEISYLKTRGYIFEYRFDTYRRL